MDVRSHYREKCCGVRVDKICYIFAIINVVLVFLSAITCVSAETFLITRVIASFMQNTFYYFMPSLVIIFPIYAVVCTLTGICGVFAVLLLQGIRLKKPKLLMAYLFFGLIVEMVMISATVISLALIIIIRIPGQNYALICGGIALAMIICTLYGFILCLVRKTYHMMRLRNNDGIANEPTSMLYICNEYLSTSQR